MARNDQIDERRIHALGLELEAAADLLAALTSADTAWSTTAGNGCLGIYLSKK